MAQYSGSGPGRFFRAWRYHHRRRLTVINYVSVLCGFLAILITFLFSYYIFSSRFLSETVAICLPEEGLEERVDFIHEALWSEYHEWPGGPPWYVGYYVCPEAEEYTGFTVRYFSDAQYVKEHAKDLYEFTKKVLTSRIRELYPDAGGVLRGRLVRGDISQAPGRHSRRRMGYKYVLLYENYPELRYEIWIGRRLLVPENELAPLQAPTE